MTNLNRVTVNLVPKADQALERAAELTGDNRTDTINRALQYYAFLCEERHAGRDVYLASPADLAAGHFNRLVVM